LRRPEGMRHSPRLSPAGNLVGASHPAGARRLRNDFGAAGKGGRSSRHLGRRTLCRSQVGHADAEPWLPGIHQRHRLFRASVQDPSLDANQLPRFFGRALPVADARRKCYGAGLASLAYPLLFSRRVGHRQKANSAGADSRRKQSAAGRPSADARPDVGGMMLRVDCLRSVYSELENCLVVTIMGAVAAELQSLGHRPNFFYLQHAMGLASSTGLGLALCLPEQKVIVFDGDGSLLMNLGSLSTMARYRPSNMVHVVFDNESLLSVGGFPTATSTGTDLEGIARAAGIPRVTTVRNVESFNAAVTDAMRGSELTTIIAKVEAKGPAAYVTDLSLLENRFQFRRHIQSLKKS